VADLYPGARHVADVGLERAAEAVAAFLTDPVAGVLELV
jgi:hypothetical protein